MGQLVQACNCFQQREDTGEHQVSLEVQRRPERADESRDSVGGTGGQARAARLDYQLYDLDKSQDKSLDTHAYAGASIGNSVNHDALGKKASLDDFTLMSQATKDSMSSEQKFLRVLNFKDFKGFKKVKNIKERYKIGRVLGEGSFGQVRIALHRAAELKCAIKIIRKDKIAAH